ncbi:hypothetical protein VB774_17275 [Pseudanabaena galeata UHCC 0370]|uniref:Uncharacterized protein n=1 Tax=Pseudanabaena galeata UHCC 0370 TaxID=3110310 RepID=A0ABU5TM85_9CYAN|nr:hypothetical protein [Pseudanabaena galeata]MEA5479375.1 hypothetical protein [Pseudanabaena galeata UHCC 0370]
MSDYFLLSRDHPMVYTVERDGIVYQQRGEEQADRPYPSSRISKAIAIVCILC